MRKFSTKGVPSWMNQRINRKRGTLVLRGNSTWVGQPVIDRVRVRLDDKITGVNVNRAMGAQWRFIGNSQRNKFIFGDQAGAITKRFNSVMDFGKDNVRDTFVFTNTTQDKGPFNHMQRYVIKNFGEQDVIKLRNIGKTFRADDLIQTGKNRYKLPGVDSTKLRIDTSLL